MRVIIFSSLELIKFAKSILFGIAFCRHLSCVVRSFDKALKEKGFENQVSVPGLLLTFCIAPFLADDMVITSSDENFLRGCKELFDLGRTAVSSALRLLRPETGRDLI